MTAWDKVLQHMERRVNPHSFATWFRPTRQESTENGKLIVRVPTRMFRKRLSETYGELIHAVLTEVGFEQAAAWRALLEAVAQQAILERCRRTQRLG